jgi:electron transfer flavoprotein alpha subunit
MKALLVGEYRQGRLLDSTYETIAFAEKFGAEAVMFVAGSEDDLPRFTGRLYLADAVQCGEYNPAVHKALLLSVISREEPDLVVFLHSSYGWDLAPRIAATLNAAQVSEVVDVEGEAFIVPVCNAKLRRHVRGGSAVTVITLQAGAFSLAVEPEGDPVVEHITTLVDRDLEFLGYEIAECGKVDLSRADVIVSAGRGIGKAENVEIIARLASALGGELGASRPVVDAGWVEHSRQVGTTGQSVAPRLYIACGISGAIQHLAGMKKSGFIIAINKDKEAPIGEISDVLVVADALPLATALIERLSR